MGKQPSKANPVLALIAVPSWVVIHVLQPLFPYDHPMHKGVPPLCIWAKLRSGEARLFDAINWGMLTLIILNALQ